MPATIKNLTEQVVSVPLVDYNFGPREVRRFEFQEYDVLLNDETVVRLIDLGTIQVEQDPSGAIPPHAVTHEDGGSDELEVTDLAGLLADPQTPTAHAAGHQAGGADELQHQTLQGAGTNTHAQIDAHVADVTTNPHQVDLGTLAPGTLAQLDSLVTDADLASILERYHLASRAPASFKQLTYTGKDLTKVELYSGTVVLATGVRTLTFNDLNPDTITASSGDFTTEDFSAGEYVGVQGTTSNDGVYLIGSVAATTITLDAAETLTAEGPLASGASLHALDTHLFTQDLSYTLGNLTEVLVTWETTSDQVRKVLTYSGANLVQVSLQEVP